LLGGLLAWLLKDIWGSLDTGWWKFFTAKPVCETYLWVSPTVFFSLAIRGIIRINDSINDQSIVKPRQSSGNPWRCTGALIFYLVYGTGTLDTGRWTGCLTWGIIANIISGGFFYRNDPWMFPLGLAAV
jgi:hypothetical protein